MEYPTVTVVMTTFFPIGEKGLVRMDVARETIRSWWTYLRYGGDLRLHVADDGSPYPEFNAYRYWYHGYPTYSKQERHGVGASLNAGFRQAFENGSDVIGYFVDDWALTQNFDITPWVRLLMEREDVGMVRLGPPHPGITGKAEMLTEDWQGWGLRLCRDEGFIYAQRPALYHKRFYDFYGPFAEDCSALECESLCNAKVCADWRGPDIVMALPHPFFHLDSTSMSSVDPKDI